MLRRTASVVAVAFIGTLLLVQEADAQTALNRAVVESLRNQVQLLQNNRSSRAARVSDVLVPGNGVSTAQQSFAELRFNDGSLGRLGERVVFWFTPGSREFRLSNGTALLLIPPGRGRTNVHTPNATAGIQGSALFVRYIAETDTTVVGALTDSGIEVINLDGSQQQVLRGGQMAVARGDRITGVYEFDLRTFYETSQLVRGLAPEFDGNLSGQSQDSPGGDTGIAAVQEEMQRAIAQQPPLPIEGVMETPDFVRLPTNTTTPTTAPGELPVPEIEAPSTSVPREEGQPFNEQPLERPPSLQPAVRPTRQPLQDRIERAPVDPRLDEDNRLPDRPGQGNGQPIRDDRPGNDGRPGNGGQTGNNERPGRGGRGNRPGNGGGNGRPDNDRPGNGNNRPGNGNNRPGNGNGNDRPGNGNNRPGNGNGNDRPGNGNGDDRPGNSNNRPGNGNGRPGNGNGDD